MEPGCYISKVRVRIPQGLLENAAPVVGTLPGALIKKVLLHKILSRPSGVI